MISPAAQQLVVISLGALEYAVPYDAVRAIAPMDELRPAAAPCVGLLGLARVEGASVPVFDLGERLGEQPAACAPRALVIVAVHRASVGLAADAIEQITLVEHILLAPHAEEDPVAALAEIDDRLVPLLDPEGLASTAPVATVAVAA